MVAALAFLEKNFPDTAVSDLNTGDFTESRYVEAYCQRARAQSRLGNYVSAISDCTEAIRLKPECSLAYYHRFYAYLQFGNYERALADLHEVGKLDLSLEQDPSLVQELKRAEAEIYYRRGSDYMAKKDWYKAIDDFDLAKKLEPELFQAAYFQDCRNLLSNCQFAVL